MTTKKSSLSSSNGGIFGSGINGILGTVVTCNSTDNSYYCNLMKIINVSIIILVILFFIFIIYSYFSNRKGKK
jgi:hypothetical protein